MEGTLAGAASRCALGVAGAARRGGGDLDEQVREGGERGALVRAYVDVLPVGVGHVDQRIGGGPVGDGRGGRGAPGPGGGGGGGGGGGVRVHVFGEADAHGPRGDLPPPRGDDALHAPLRELHGVRVLRRRWRRPDQAAPARVDRDASGPGPPLQVRGGLRALVLLLDLHARDEAVEHRQVAPLGGGEVLLQLQLRLRLVKPAKDGDGLVLGALPGLPGGFAG